MKASRAAAVLFVFLLSALLVIPASAHALFVRSVPGANAVLARPPAQVEIFFTEALESGLSSIVVMDANARVVSQGDLKVDPDNSARMTVSLRSLVDGVYTVSWRASSATDGHVSSGSFPFAIGAVQTGAFAAAPPEKSQFQLSPLDVIIQWLLLAALAVLAGGLPFKRLIWLPALRSAALESPSPKDPPAWKMLLAVSLLAIFALLGADLLVQASQAANYASVFIFAENLASFLLKTRQGLIWLIRLVLAILSAWLVFSRAKSWKPVLLLLAALLLLFSIVMTSHSAAEASPFLPVLVNWLHLLAISAWIGGLAYFVPAVWQLRRMAPIERTRLISLLVPRFSVLALLSVALTALSGVYLSVLRVGALPALLNSLYGQVLLGKLALAAPLVVMGAVNLLWISPRLKRDRLQALSNAALITHFGRIILAEVILGVLVLLGASLLASLPPAVVPTSTNAQAVHVQVDDLQEDLTVSPGRVGLNTFSLRIQAAGQPLNAAKEVLLRFTAAEQDLPPSDVQMIAQGGGLYEAKGSNLSMPGKWSVQVIVRRENKFDAYAAIDLQLKTASASASGPLRQNPGIPAALLLLIALGYGLLMDTLLPSSRLRAGLGVPPALVLLLLSFLILITPTQTSLTAVNPLPANETSIRAGKTLYTLNCVSCHGPLGKGDGPAGKTFNPRPADLSLHGVPGVHTDGELFQWISQGYPGTPMPAFETRLSVAERWNLVNYLRALAAK